LADYNIVQPADPPENASQYDVESWKKQLDILWNYSGIYLDNKRDLYILIWEQSLKTMKSKLAMCQEYLQWKENYDSLKLLKLFRESMTDNIKIKQKIGQKSILQSSSNSRNSAHSFICKGGSWERNNPWCGDTYCQFQTSKFEISNL
jgi:hypothetical protein